MSARAEAAADRSEIRQVLFRYARGVDRIDFDLIRSCFHPGGMDSRPPLFHGSIDRYVEWVEPQLRRMESSNHMIGNTFVQLDGDRAEVESYYLATLRTRQDGRLIEALRGGRYVDSFSRRDGRWAIDIRRAVTDWSRIEDVTEKTDPGRLSAFLADQAPDMAPLQVSRDSGDVSYETLPSG